MPMNNVYDLMQKLYRPYVMLNGVWDYSLYTSICNENGFTVDRLVTAFTDKVGFFVAATQQFPDADPYRSLAQYAKAGMLHQHNSILQSQGKPTESESSAMDIKPCCGGGAIK